MKKNIPTSQWAQQQRGGMPTPPVVYDDSNLEYAPCDDLLLLQLESQDSTAGGIVIPDIAKAKHRPKWKVLKVGPGRIGPNGALIPMRTEVGQTVLIQPDRGMSMTVPGHEDLLLVAESCVVAVITEKQS